MKTKNKQKLELQVIDTYNDVKDMDVRELDGKKLNIKKKGQIMYVSIEMPKAVANANVGRQEGYWIIMRKNPIKDTVISLENEVIILPKQN